jgi:molybdopterin-guanine dinucleotide biosynthesis protein B
MGKQLPVLSFCAYASNSGKTTLLTQLIPALTKRGLRVSVIKHAHHSFDIDYPTKDSYKLREAGAVQTMIASNTRWALITEHQDTVEPNLNTSLSQLDSSLSDLVLVEGFRHEAIPKIEVFRASLEQPLLAEHDSTIIAIASDTALDSHLPVLDLNNIKQIADFVIKFTIQSNHP